MALTLTLWWLCVMCVCSAAGGVLFPGHCPPDHQRGSDPSDPLQCRRRFHGVGRFARPACRYVHRRAALCVCAAVLRCGWAVLRLVLTIALRSLVFLAGALGLTLDTTSGRISGTPTALAAQAAYTITAKNS